VIERPFLKGLIGFTGLFFLMSPFFMAHVFTYALGANFAMLGVAWYVGTGRGFWLEHKPLNEWLTAFTKSHFIKGLAVSLISAISIVVWMNPTLLFLRSESFV
jgi:hypothetical protein